eukprot:TRINITY_DN4368_c0_g1_i1.p1 TRINITY_DN4368_c0_g1~~TRINITY_DN4368_c0_g1_i1.p1  ORF type:complete len:395 (+),score=86.78 TRINITY_DN4368_c0_g1_i1:31-1215(+)
MAKPTKTKKVKKAPKTAATNPLYGMIYGIALVAAIGTGIGLKYVIEKNAYLNFEADADMEISIEEIYRENEAAAYRLSNVVSEREAQFLSHAIPESSYSTRGDIIDGGKIYEFLPIVNGIPDRSISKAYEKMIKTIHRRLTPIVRGIYNDSDTVPCTVSLRRYRQGERTKLAVHRDEDNHATVVIVLKATDDGSSGSYISGKDGKHTYMKAGLGDGLVYGPNVRHGVDIGAASGTRYSMPVWFQKNSTWCDIGEDHRKIRNRRFDLNDRNQDGKICWGEWVTNYMDFDHDWCISSSDWSEFLKQSGMNDIELNAAESHYISQVPEVLQKCDTDNSGSACLDEMNQCGAPEALKMALRMTSAGNSFFTADANNNLKISKKEWGTYDEMSTSGGPE